MEKGLNNINIYCFLIKGKDGNYKFPSLFI